MGVHLLELIWVVLVLRVQERLEMEEILPLMVLLLTEVEVVETMDTPLVGRLIVEQVLLVVVEEELVVEVRIKTLLLPEPFQLNQMKHLHLSQLPMEILWFMGWFGYS